MTITESGEGINISVCYATNSIREENVYTFPLSLVIDHFCLLGLAMDAENN